MGRRYPEHPVVGVGAVILAQGQALLIKRGNPPGQGLWSLPGGAVELGESLAQAVAREVAEETGLTVTPGPLVGVFERRLADPDGRLEYHYVLLDYLCPLTETPQPRAGDDAAAARWVPLEDLEGLGLAADTLGVIRKGAELLARGGAGG